MSPSSISIFNTVRKTLYVISIKSPWKNNKTSGDWEELNILKNAYADGIVI